MNRSTQGALLALVGVVVLGMVAGDRYLAMVRPVMRWPLALAALVLLVAAARQLLGRARPPGSGPEHDQALGDDGGHGHHHGGPRVGVLLAVPFLLMAILPVAPLSSWTAQRVDGVERAPEPSYAPLPPGDREIDLPTSEFVERAVYDHKASLTGRRVRLTGFVSTDPDGWALTRMVMICCAADAYPVKVRVSGPAPTRRDGWVQVVGTWVPAPPYDGRGAAPWPRLQVESVHQVVAPKDPYE